jgi:uncharacterized membrane protein YdcZ (DUF606 family)
VVAQLVASTVIDQFGLFGAPLHPVDRAADQAITSGTGAVRSALR